MAVLRGKIVSGVGSFSYWIDQLHDHYYRKTGLHLFPGTLNVELREPYNLPKEVIRLEKEEYGGRVSVSIVPCRLFGRKAFILRTDQNEQEVGHHSRRIVEVASDVKFRDLYKLSDGDTVEIELLTSDPPGKSRGDGP